MEKPLCLEKRGRGGGVGKWYGRESGTEGGWAAKQRMESRDGQCLELKVLNELERIHTEKQTDSGGRLGSEKSDLTACAALATALTHSTLMR